MGKPRLNLVSNYESQNLHESNPDEPGCPLQEPHTSDQKPSGDEKQHKAKKVYPNKPYVSTSSTTRASELFRNTQPSETSPDLTYIRSILKKPTVVSKDEVKSKKDDTVIKAKRRRPKNSDDSNNDAPEEVHAEGINLREKKGEVKYDKKFSHAEARRVKTLCPDSLIAAASSVANSIMRLAASPTGTSQIEPLWGEVNKDKESSSTKGVEKTKNSDKERGGEKEGDEKTEIRGHSAAPGKRRVRKIKPKVGEEHCFANSDNPTVKNAWPLHCAFLAALQECSPRLIPALSANNEAAFLNAMWSCFWRGYRAGFQASVRELEASLTGSNKAKEKAHTSSTPGKQPDSAHIVPEKPSSK